MNKGKANLHFKVGLIGETNVGKTNIASRFAKNKFSNDNLNTPVISISYQNVQKEKLIIELKILDLGGQKRYREAAAAYFQEMDGCFIVYDITDQDSFQNIEEWYKKIKEAKPDIPIIIIGNKCDLEDSRKVSFEEAREQAQKLNCLFYETSAFDSTNINEIFNKMAELIFEKKFSKRENVNMKFNNVKGKKKNCCCDCIS